MVREALGGSDRVEYGDQFDPTPTLDNGGGPWWWLKIVPSVTGSDFRSLKVFLGVTAAPLRRPARFAVVEQNETSNAPHSRIAACLRARFGKCACQCTGSPDTYAGGTIRSRCPADH